jgi:succinyl-CoA synthetase beta subunit
MKKDVASLLKRSGPLAENEVKDLLNAYDIPTTKYVVIKNPQDLKKLPLKFPVALKVCSSKILHKTDVNGVLLDISSMEELEKAVKDFNRRFPGEKLLVDQMAKKGVELIIGLIQDHVFGRTIMCGIGGIFTELYKDVSFRIVPIDRDDANDMIEELKGKKLLDGFRNIKTDKKQVLELLLKVSDISEKIGDFIDQLDLNPVLVYEHGLCVVDAKMILKEKVE